MSNLPSTEILSLIAQMREDGRPIVECIKTVKFRFDIDLAQAKSFVTSHPAWSQIVEANEALHEEAISAAMSQSFSQYSVVRVASICDDRFKGTKIFYTRLPRIGDRGTILEVHEPEVSYEVECSDPETGVTIWLETMYAHELELIQEHNA